MKDWKKYGPSNVGFWSLILVVVGLCQLTFGAYYIVKLPVFKIGSPVWIGFLNVLFGSVLFGLHHKTLELRRSIAAGRVTEKELLRQSRRACRWRLNLSLCTSLFVVFINTSNVVICEVGEWQHWLTYFERKQLRDGALSHFALQAYRVSSVQMGASILIGVICTSLNLWHLYRHQNAACKWKSVECNSRTVSRRSSSIHSSRKTTCSSSRRLPTGYDNATWVYGDDSNGVSSHPQPSGGGIFVTATSHQSPSGGQYPNQMKAAVRYATIRRAASIIPSLPDNFTTMRNQVRSCSFRVDQQPHPVATVQRSNTVSQVPIPAASPTMGFAQRFKFNPQPLQSDMSFVHDGLDSATDKATEQLSIRDEVISAIKLAEAGKKPPLPPTVPTSYVRNCNRIVLRVESLRTPPATAVERSPSSVGLPVLIHKRPVRNIKRVSSSTQTELSVLKRKVSTVPSQQSGHLIKRLIPLEKHWSTADDCSPKALALTEVAPLMNSPSLNSMQMSPGYSVGSSSGYSSPRSSESKSPTPEPLAHAADLSAQSSLNVTVIHIDPSPTNTKIWTKEIRQGVNGVHQTNQMDHSTPIRAIPSKPVSRTVSFQHKLQPSAGTKSSPLPNDNWIYSSLASDYVRSPIIPIPRPVLRYANCDNRYVFSRKPESVSVERSASVAASEIQRKLEFLQRAEQAIASRTSPVPVHDCAHFEPYSDSGYQDEDQSWSSINRSASDALSLSEDVPVRRKSSIRPPGLALAQEVDALNSTQTLAYLSQLEDLARHWKTQLMYKVELKSPSQGMTSSIDQDSFQC